MDTVETLKYNIMMFNSFMVEALKDNNTAGYTEAAKNLKLCTDALKALQYKLAEKHDTITVFSRGIAESLCVDYGYFNQLIGIEKDKNNPKRKKYIFSVSGDIEKNFNELLDKVRKFKEEKKQQCQEIDKALEENNSAEADKVENGKV